MEWHPFAMKFPLLEGEDQKAFDASIRKSRGNRVPVLYRMVKTPSGYQKQGVDGRNRHESCERQGLKCRMEEVILEDDEVVDFILDHNERRRHMTREQRQIIVAELRSMGKSERAIAESLGVSKTTVHKDLAEPPGGHKRPPETPGTISGRDGKVYQPTQPARPKPAAKHEIMPEIRAKVSPHFLPTLETVNFDDAEQAAFLAHLTRGKAAHEAVAKVIADFRGREPGDDTDEIAAERHRDKHTPPSGAIVFSIKAFNLHLGHAIAELDKLAHEHGQVHPSNGHFRPGMIETAEYRGIVRKIEEVKADVKAWRDRLEKLQTSPV